MRPLRRRADKMARPARVRMRRRKPWTFARRRLFGWKVRLLIMLSDHITVHTGQNRKKTVATRPTRQRYALVPSSVKLTHGQHAPSSCIYPQESIPSESYPQLDSEQATGVKSS